MPSILESVASLLGQGDTFGKLGSLIGGDAKQAETAVETAGPALLGGLSEMASMAGGSAALATMLDDTDPSIVDDPEAYVEGVLDAGDDVDTDGGESILDTLFGGDRGALLDGLASRSGLGAGMFGKLLPVLAPLFVGVVARRRADEDLDADGVAGLVAGEREGLETDGKLGDWFSNLLAGGGALAAAAAVGAAAKDKLGDVADEVEDKLDDAKDKLGDALGGLKDRLTGDGDDADGEVGESESESDEEVGVDADADAEVDSEVDADGARTGAKALAAAAVVGAAAVGAKAASGAVDAKAGDGKTGDGKTGDSAKSPAKSPATSQAKTKAGASAKGSATTKAGGNAADKTVGVRAAAATSGAKATASGKPGTLAARLSDRSAPAASAGGSGLPGWTRWAVGAAALVAVLAIALSQCGSGTTTATEADGSATTEATGSRTEATEESDGAAAAGDGADDEEEAVTTTAADDDADTTEAAAATTTTAAAPTTTAPTTTAPAETDVDALVQAALTAADLGSGITASVVDGVVTLSGSVETDEARTAAETAVAAVDGVTGVDNQVVVEPAPAAPAAAGSTLNDVLGLEPITFNYLSARITAGGEAVLAQVVTYLDANAGDVEIQGHTDSDGSDDKNLTLSQARAESVKAFLVANGIDAARLTTVGLGEANPKVPNDSLINKATNRRIEFILK